MAEQEEHAPHIASILERLNVGDQAAFQSLLPLVYDELRSLANLYMSQERPGHTLQPTALVNEAYLRLSGRTDINWLSRAHFLGVAAHTMRQVLIAHARVKRAKKRGGDHTRVEMDEAERGKGVGLGDTPLPPHGEQGIDLGDIIDLDRALTRLSERAGRQAQVVELLYFGGMTSAEAAEVVGTTSRTVERDWAAARAWLLRELSRSASGSRASGR